MSAEFSNAPNLIVQALAGTGKTTTIKQGAFRMNWEPMKVGFVPSDEQEAVMQAMLLEGHPGRMHLTSFSSDAVAQLKIGVPEGVTASSTYGMGLSAAKRKGMASHVDKKSTKYYRLMSDFLGGRWKGEGEFPGLTSLAVKLCEKARLELRRSITEEELKVLCDHYSIELEVSLEKLTEAVNYLLKKGLEMTESFDYTDMVWIPLLKYIVNKEYDHLVVDEYQDMGLAQQEICYRVARRIMAIGDQNQAVYGFMSADVAATETFRTALSRTARGVKVFPMTLTRRCGKEIVRYANSVLHTGLEAVPDAPEGRVDFTTTGQFDVKTISSTDMVICPTNAPLISLMFKMDKVGRKSYVRKSDVVDSMKEYVTGFNKGIVELRTSTKRRWDQYAEGKSRAMRALRDRFECLNTMAMNCATVDEVNKLLILRFAEDNRKGVTRLSTVHRAKGLEAKRVVFWEYNRCGAFAEKNWEKVEAINLRYVGATRAADELVLAGAAGL